MSGNELAHYHYGSDEPQNVISSLASLHTEGSTSAVDASRSLQFLFWLHAHTPDSSIRLYQLSS
jgi:hypothetical protein